MESKASAKQREASSAKQREASSPKNHVWTTANAGSGKTRVLVDRVLRLLLAGEDAHRILCVTYTRMAAVEMMARVRRVLGEWSVMSDEALGEKLLELQEDVSDEDIGKARGLFLKVLDTPGGLQIHTFHGFCSSVLKRFPLEADVTPGFELVEEGDVKLLKVLSEELANRRDTDPKVRVAIGFLSVSLSQSMGEKNFREMVEKIYKERKYAERILGTDSRVYGAKLNGYLEKMWEELDVPKTREDMEKQKQSLVCDEELERGLRKIMREVSGKKTADNIREAIADFLSGDESERARKWRDFVDVFFKKDGNWRVNERKAVEACGNIFVIEDIERFQGRILRLQSRYEWGHATESFLRIAVVILGCYERYKQRKGLLDYDDLIKRVEDLLGKAGSDQAGWVHFKLDGGIRHVLVDEAQDTNYEQWSILESLVHEFFAGKGVEEKEEKGERTLFVVGDPKQSIFSFQGAELEAMKASKKSLDRFAEGVGKEIKEVGLAISFRSGREVLSYVDRVFLDERLSGLGMGEDEVLAHESSRYVEEGVKGFVMVLPLCKAVESDEGKQRRGDDTLARALVEGLESLMESRLIVPSTGKALKAGDVMFLFQTHRKMRPVMRVLQKKGWEFTTKSDEKLSENLVVGDVVNVLEVVLSPEDDYRLACVMKSPFVGWGEEDLLELAYDRGKKSLWDCVKERAWGGGKEKGGGEKEQRLWRWIEDLRRDRQRRGPYSLVNRLMYEPCPFGEGRVCTGYQAMVGRLGEAREALEVLLRDVRKREGEGCLSLRDMLDEIASNEESMKVGGGAEDVVRLMTVHGAKGLEAPIVVLADTVKVQERGIQDFNIHAGEVKGEQKLWYGKKEGIRQCELPYFESLNSIGDKDEEEKQRLLYVALTRAKDGVVVAGSYEQKEPKKNISWYTYLRGGIDLRGGIEGMEGVRKVPMRGGLWDGGGEEDSWEGEDYWVVGDVPYGGETGEEEEAGDGG